MPALTKPVRLPRTTRVRGFEFASYAAGLRYSGRPDLALVVATAPCAAAAVFTKNRVVAAPVTVCREHLSGARTHRAVLVNAGRANACTGESGLADARESCAALAELLGCKPEQVLPLSTGIIGQRIDVKKLTASLPNLTGELDGKSFPALATAIGTTDTFPKYAAKSVVIAGHKYEVAGIAKGSGMIMPNMATMLGILLTDAPVGKAILQQALREVTEETFNAISVDGDTSTNDTVIAMASGAGGGPAIRAGTREYRVFVMALLQVALKLSQLIVRDGEGATKFVSITVKGAKSKAQAHHCAMTIANSPLVKTAMAGEDPNWGRIVGAAGRSAAVFDHSKIELFIGGAQLVKGGLYTSQAQEKRAHKAMKKTEYEIVLDLKAGEAQASVYTCDLTKDYISINADYRS